MIKLNFGVVYAHFSLNQSFYSRGNYSYTFPAGFKIKSKYESKIMTVSNQLPTTKWKLKEAGDKNIENLLSKEFGIHPIISQILVNRGIQDMEVVRHYLYPSLNDLHSPF
jgi:hypothetical protein